MTSTIRLLRMAIALVSLAAFGPMPAGAQGQQASLPIEIVPVTSHATAVLSAALSPDGSRVISASSDSTLKLWDAASGRLLRTFEGHSASVNSVVFSPDGMRAFSGSDDKTIMLWDLATGRLLRTFEGHADKVRSVAVSRDGALVLSASYDRTIKLWDAASGRLLRTQSGHADAVNSVAFSPDGSRALSGSRDRTAKLWDVATGRLLRTLQGHALAVMSVAFSSDGTRVISGSMDKTVRLWDATSGQLLRTFAGHANWVLAAAMSPDGTRIVSGGLERALRVWDVATGRVQSFANDKAPIWSLVFSSDGTRVLAGADAPLLLDPATGRVVRSFTGDATLVAAVAFSRDGSRVLAASGGNNNNNMTSWDVSTGQPLSTFAGHTAAVTSLALSRDGGTVLTGSADKTLKLWDVASGRLVRTLEGHSEIVNSVALSRDGGRALSGSYDKTIRLWDVASGRLLRTFAGSEHAVGSVAFSPDGSRLASGSYDIRVIPAGFDKSVKIWDAANGALLRTLTGHANQVTSVAFSPDGKRVLSGSSDRTIKLWDAASGQLLRTFEGHAAKVAAVAFSLDGARALSGSYDKTIKLWDVATGRLIRTYPGHWSEVDAVAFSPDGRLVLSGSRDTTTGIWSTETGDLLVRLVSSGSGEWLAITPEGFFAASDNGAEMLSAVRGLEIYSINQLYQSLYRPDLVREKLAGDARGLVRAAAARLDLGKVLASGSAPVVTMLSPADGTRAAAPQITAEVEIANRGGGIGRVEWRVNGVTVGVEDRGAAGAPAPAGPPLRLARGLALDAGDNEIEVVAYNGANLVASVPARATVTAPVPATQSPPHLLVLAVGVNDYADARFKLNLAVADARSLADAFATSAKGLYQDVDITVLLDRDVNRAGLDAAFKALAAKAQPTDVVVFYIGGHGITLGGRYYFVPQDFRVPADTALTRAALDPLVTAQGIPQEQWQQWFAAIRAKNSVMLFDTCESGSLADDGAETRALERGGANDRLVRATGRSVMTAASGDQEAIEGYRGHGLFTYQILEALGSADSDRDGKIEVAELAAYVYAQVSALSEQVFGQRQVPQVRIVGSDYALAATTAIVAAPEPGVAISTRPTHRLATGTDLLVQPAIGARRVHRLDAQTAVTLVKDEHGFTLVARDGKPIGYVAASGLVPVQ